MFRAETAASHDGRDGLDESSVSAERQAVYGSD